MPKRGRLEPDVMLKLPTSEFLAPCSIEKGVITVSYEKMTAVLQRAKGRQLGSAAPQQNAQLDKLRAEVEQLKKDAKMRQREADPNEGGEESGTNKKGRKAAKKAEKEEKGE